MEKSNDQGMPSDKKMLEDLEHYQSKRYFPDEYLFLLAGHLEDKDFFTLSIKDIKTNYPQVVNFFANDSLMKNIKIEQIISGFNMIFSSVFLTNRFRDYLSKGMSIDEKKNYEKIFESKIIHFFNNHEQYSIFVNEKKWEFF